MTKEDILQYFDDKKFELITNGITADFWKLSVSKEFVDTLRETTDFTKTMCSETNEAMYKFLKNSRKPDCVVAKLNTIFLFYITRP